MRVSIFHNISHDSRFTDWTPAAAMALVDEYDIPAPDVEGDQADVELQQQQVLGRVWREQNAVDGSERPVRLGHRSLSVGDVVQLDGRAFAVRSLGWRQIDPARIRRAASVTIHVDPRLLSRLDEVLSYAELSAELMASRSPLDSQERRDWQAVTEAVYLGRAAARARATSAGGEGEQPAG
jgi:hypothetical protein